jgi:hypothetical protein
MSFLPSTEAIALACGAAGAYVDVTADIREDDPVSERMGRQSEFDDIGPGQLSFVLDNGDGKYTPGNASSTLATPLVEGMGVTWVQDGLLVSGKIRSAVPYFISDYASAGSSRVRVVADDALGAAGRHSLGNLDDELFAAAGGLNLWTLSDSSGSNFAVDSKGSADLRVDDKLGSPGTNPITFGSTSHIPTGTVVALSSAGGTNSAYLSNYGLASTLGRGVAESWGVWMERTAEEFIQASWGLNSTGGGLGSLSIAVTSGSYLIVASITATAGVSVVGPVMQAGVAYDTSITVTPAFVAGSWQLTLELFVDGVSYGTALWAPGGVTAIASTYNSFTAVSGHGSGVAGTFYLGRLRHSVSAINEKAIYSGTEATRLQTLAGLMPEMVLDTLPAGLSTSPVGEADTSGQNALDALNDVIRTEQGHMYSVTTGTYLAPVAKVKVRERDRPQTVTAARTFDITEIDSSPTFIRDISTMVSQATARGTLISQTVNDTSLIPYVGSAAASGKTIFLQGADLRAWAQDRIIRGKNVSVRIAQFTVDAMGNMPASRWADLTAIVPGDRVRVTGLPVTQLGVSSLDFYVLGRTRSSTKFHKTFTFYLSPTIPAVGIFDTDRYMADGALSLSAGINSAVTSMSVATSDQTVKLSTTETPYYLQVDNEIVLVTACTAATPQVATIARAQLGTTAASHSSAALVELANTTPSLTIPATVYAF